MYKKQETIFNTQAEFKHNCNGAKVVAWGCGTVCKNLILVTDSKLILTEYRKNTDMFGVEVFNLAKDKTRNYKTVFQINL